MTARETQQRQREVVRRYPDGSAVVRAITARNETHFEAHYELKDDFSGVACFNGLPSAPVPFNTEESAERELVEHGYGPCSSENVRTRLAACLAHAMYRSGPGSGTARRTHAAELLTEAVDAFLDRKLGELRVQLEDDVLDRISTSLRR